MLFVGRIIESSLDYSLSNTAQQTLWLVTSREAKYKAKQVVDAFCRRAGDALSAGVVFLGMRWSLSTRGFLAINVGATLAWMAFAFVIGRMWAARTATSAPHAEAEAPVRVAGSEVAGEGKLPRRAPEDPEHVPIE